MKSLLLLLATFACTLNLSGQQKDKLLYWSDFSKPLGSEWLTAFTKSKVKNGYLRGAMPKNATHESIYQLELEPYGDIDIQVDYYYDGADSFNISMRDKAYKGSHAGHICRLKVFPEKIMMLDFKYGYFSNEVRAMKVIDKETKKRLRKTFKEIPYKQVQKKWHRLNLTIRGRKMTLAINGKILGSFERAGFAHNHKNWTQLCVMGDHVRFDNLKITKPE